MKVAQYLEGVSQILDFPRYVANLFASIRVFALFPIVQPFWLRATIISAVFVL